MKPKKKASGPTQPEHERKHVQAKYRVPREIRCVARIRGNSAYIIDLVRNDVAVRPLTEDEAALVESEIP